MFLSIQWVRYSQTIAWRVEPTRGRWPGITNWNAWLSPRVMRSCEHSSRGDSGLTLTLPTQVTASPYEYNLRQRGQRKCPQLKIIRKLIWGKSCHYGKRKTGSTGRGHIHVIFIPVRVWVDLNGAVHRHYILANKLNRLVCIRANSVNGGEKIGSEDKFDFQEHLYIYISFIYIHICEDVCILKL